MNYPIAQSLAAVAIALLVIFAFNSPCRADRATPILEMNNQLEDVSETRACVCKVGLRYLVIVFSDTEQPVPLWAKAKAGVVEDDHLGREVVVAARISKEAAKHGVFPELEILEVAEFAAVNNRRSLGPVTGPASPACWHIPSCSSRNV